MQKSFSKAQRRFINIFVTIILSSSLLFLPSNFLLAKELTLVFNDNTYTFNQNTQTFSFPPGTPQQDSKLLKTLLSFAGPNEKVRVLTPVTIGQKNYFAYYYYTGEIKDNRGEMLTLSGGQEWVKNNIKGIIVLDEKGGLVRNEDILEKIFKSYSTGYKFYQFPIYQKPDSFDVENPTKDKRGFVRNLTEDLAAKLIFADVAASQYLTDLVKGGANVMVARYEAVLKEMITNSQESSMPPDVKDYVFQGIQQGNSYYAMISEAVSSGRYSPNYKLLKKFRKLEKPFEKYEKKTPTKMFMVAPDVIGLVTALIEKSAYSDDRVELLGRLSRMLKENPGTNKYVANNLVRAIDNVLAEAKATHDEEILDNVLNFLIEKYASQPYEYAKEKFIKALTNHFWRAGQAGARSFSQHMLASAAGQISLGLTISNFLWGMDAIYTDAVNAQASMEIKENLKNLFTKVYKKERLTNNYPADYCEDLAAIAAFIKFCNASFYNNLAGIAGSSQLKTLLVDALTQMTGGPTMSDAININLTLSSDIQKYAENDFVAPPIVDYATKLSLSMQPHPLESMVAEAFISTVLILDVSGSMGDRWKGGVKIESMKSAAGRIINMLGAENTLGYVEHKIGVVSFESVARVNSPLKEDFQALYNEISRLAPTTNTNIGDALIKGLELLKAESAKISKIMVLLTDGQNNTGYKNDQILQGPVKEAVAKGIKIFTIGFGDSGGIDEGFLKEIAQRTGAQYFYALDAYRLENIYITVGHKTGSKIVNSLSGEVSQGETVVAGTFDVPPNIIDLRTSLNWPGSWLELLLKDPKGVDVEQGYPGFQLFKQARPIYAVIRNPVVGTWTASVKGIDIPKGRTSFEITTSFRTPVFPGGGLPSKEKIDWLYFLLFALIVATLVLAIAIVLVLREKRPYLFMKSGGKNRK